MSLDRIIKLKEKHQKLLNFNSDQIIQLHLMVQAKLMIVTIFLSNLVLMKKRGKMIRVKWKKLSISFNNMGALISKKEDLQNQYKLKPHFFQI